MAETEKKGNAVVETIKTVVYALLIAGVFRTLFFQPFFIPSSSMKSTLLIGDFLFVNKMSYGFSEYSCPKLVRFLCPISGRILDKAPKRGDVVVFEHPTQHRAFVKRLIGLPGDNCGQNFRSFPRRVAHNRGGGVRVVVDGMVLDVKRWLPEHPGGDRIIPAQSVNVDATRHFELYHSSKESFLYLRAFYVGEIVKEDVDCIPRVVNQVTGAIDPPASQAFLDQLREYTRGFRIDNTKERAHVRAHLGVRS